MRLAVSVLSVLTLAGAGSAQANVVLSDNEDYFAIGMPHPVTGRGRNWPAVSPLEYSNGQGVPAGTKTFKVFRSNVYSRCDNDPIQLVGYRMVIRVSASTRLPAPPNTFPLRDPALELRDAVPDPQNPGHLRPGATLIHALPAVPRAAMFSTVLVTRTFQPVPVNPATLGDFCLTADWHGGEETDTPNTGLQPSQGIVGSWMCGTTPHSSYGFLYPNGRVVQGSSRPLALHYPWITFLTEQPSMAIHSDYGKRRVPNPPDLLGHSVGSYHSDMASQPTRVGISIRAGSAFAGGTAVPLLNFGPTSFTGCTSFRLGNLGTVLLKLDLADPLFFVLDGPYNQPLDANGAADAPKLAFPVLGPAAWGFTLDWQVAVFDAGLTRVAQTGRRGIVIEI